MNEVGRRLKMDTSSTSPNLKVHIVLLFSNPAPILQWRDNSHHAGHKSTDSPSEMTVESKHLKTINFPYHCGRGPAFIISLWHSRTILWPLWSYTHFMKQRRSEKNFSGSWINWFIKIYGCPSHKFTTPQNDDSQIASKESRYIPSQTRNDCTRLETTRQDFCIHAGFHIFTDRENHSTLFVKWACWTTLKQIVRQRISDFETT